MYYRPDGLTDQISDEALRSVLGDDLEYNAVATYLGQRLRAAGRDVLRSRVELDPRCAFVAAWTLA
jgi:hypothetical protein